jgi:hypothetical protein
MLQTEDTSKACGWIAYQKLGVLQQKMGGGARVLFHGIGCEFGILQFPSSWGLQLPFVFTGEQERAL